LHDARDARDACGMESAMNDSAEVTPRIAASLILVRNAATTPEILMGLRGAFHKFAPSALAYPGGGLDAPDRTAPIAALPPAETMAQLTRLVGAETAHGLAAACARELEEETGLNFGTPPDLSQLDLLCRAVTPPGRPIRFDAFFFVAPAETVRGELAGSGELENLLWYGLDQALGLELHFATKSVLEQFRLWFAQDEATRRARVQLPVLRNRQWRWE
jgi:8-oxo-dGTP pyrophosphatase MutT (NUDIX family)